MSKKEKKTKLIFVLFRSIRFRETEVRKEIINIVLIDHMEVYIQIFTVFARHSFKI